MSASNDDLNPYRASSWSRPTEQRGRRRDPNWGGLIGLGFSVIGLASSWACALIYRAFLEPAGGDLKSYGHGIGMGLGWVVFLGFLVSVLELFERPRLAAWWGVTIGVIGLIIVVGLQTTYDDRKIAQEFQHLYQQSSSGAERMRPVTAP